VIHGGAGSDTADYSEKADDVVVALAGSVFSVVKVGGADEDNIHDIENVNGGSSNDILIGNGLANRLAGNGGDDRLTGSDSNDVLQGGAAHDRLNSGKGNDQIDGGLGNDVLVGGKNSDSFLFSAALDRRSNVDKVKDFKPGADTIVLSHAVFAELDPGGLKGKHFVLGKKAEDGNDHIIYDDGRLSYDADGKGGAKAVLFAKLKGAPEIETADFLVV
jgi:Ca2+-binding RTX toxin-like protein